MAEYIHVHILDKAQVICEFSPKKLNILLTFSGFCQSLVAIAKGDLEFGF